RRRLGLMADHDEEHQHDGAVQVTIYITEQNRGDRSRYLADKQVDREEVAVWRKYVSDAGIKHHGVQPHDQGFIAHPLHPGQADEDHAPPGGAKAGGYKVLIAPASRRASVEGIESKQVITA